MLATHLSCALTSVSGAGSDKNCANHEESDASSLNYPAYDPQLDVATGESFLGEMDDRSFAL